MKTFKYNSAINYSGYREEQSPRDKTYPSTDEIYEDLQLLEGEFYYLRIYDTSLHAYRTLDVIREHNMNFKVMLGLSLRAEENHVNHPRFGTLPVEVLTQHAHDNENRVTELIEMANQYKSIVSSVSVGNETRSIWNFNRVSIERLVEIAKRVKKQTGLPVTFCEEYGTWIKELAPLAEVVDFISLHTYPVWEGYPIEEALEKAIDSYQKVQDAYPNKDCIITETGWTTSSHGSKIKTEYANAENQKIYNQQIVDWAKENDVIVYLFEAFDEPWKGGNIPEEPEKHWGIYYVDRTRK